MSKLIKVIKVYETETVEIIWFCKDKSTYIERRTISPKSTREYKEEPENE